MTDPADFSRLDVFITGNDQHIHQMTWTNASGWSDWNDLGGTFGSAPSATWTQDGAQVVLAVEGTDGSLNLKEWNASTGWVPTVFPGPPTGFLTAPSVTVGLNREFVLIFAAGTDDNIHLKQWVPDQGWLAWA